MRRGDVLLLIVALCAGALCFANLGRLWPLVDVDLFAHRDAPGEAELAQVAALGFADGAQRGARLRVEEPALDYLQHAFGRERAHELIRAGLPVAQVRATWKRAGDADSLTMFLHPDGRVLGFQRGVQEDAPGASLSEPAAEALARATLADRLGLPVAAYAPTRRARHERPERRDHELTFERRYSDQPELRERVDVLVAGDQVARAQRAVVVPASFERRIRVDRAGMDGLQALGMAGLASAAVAALAVFFDRLRRGGVRLVPAARLVALILVLLVAVDLGQQALLHEQWDPLWPRWIADAKLLVEWNVENVAIMVVLLAFLAAGDAIDREPARRRDWWRDSAGARPVPADRGASLWLLASGRCADPRVIAASLRGFLLGLVCGGVLTVAVVALGWLVGAPSALQPRGFFFFPLNSAAPAAITLCFFLHIALIEELGYRFFAGAWIDRRTGRRWLAIIAPAAIYGLMHSTMTFLPPAEPAWARPLALALVGMVWGWAFFRYDALTVVLSHLACDLFIFTWPMMASGEARHVATALAVVAAPLAPAVVGLAWSAWRPAPRTDPPGA